MGIRDLNKTLADRRLIHTAPISALKGARVGIDGFHWLKNNVTITPEPFQVAMGGVPITLLATIEKEIQKLKKAGIIPVFVFNGMSTKKHKTETTEILDKRRAAWGAYERGQVRAAGSLFLATATGIPLDWINAILQYFRDTGVEFFRAPYLAWAQLAKFLDRDRPLVHAIYGATELLMFMNQISHNDTATHHTRLIISLSRDSEGAYDNFDFVDKREVLGALAISNDAFVDCCLLAGSFFMTTQFPPLLDIPNSNTQSFFFAHDMVINVGGTGESVIKYYMTHPEVQKQDYYVQFQSNKNLIMHHPVLGSDGLCTLLDSKNAPKDMHDIIGSRLPNEFYYMLSTGLVNPNYLSTLIQGTLYEPQPLVDSVEHRGAVDKVTGGLLNVVPLLADTYKNKKYTLLKWFDSANPIELTPIGATVNWPSTTLSQLEKNLQGKKTVDYQLVCKGSVKPGQPDKNLLSAEETKSLVLLRSLDILGYFENGELSQSGQAIGNADLFPDLTLLLFEVIKGGFLTSTQLTSTRKVYTSFTTGVEKTIENENEIRFISRVLSLLPLTFKASVPWNSVVNSDMMGFNSIVKIYHRNIRLLLESLLLGVVLERRTTCQTISKAKNFTLPFHSDNNTAMGLLATHILSTPVIELTVTPKTFASCSRPLDEFAEVAIPFWEQCVRIVKQSGKFENVAKEFESADKVWNMKKSQWKEAKLFKTLN